MSTKIFFFLYHWARKFNQIFDSTQLMHEIRLFPFEGASLIEPEKLNKVSEEGSLISNFVNVIQILWSHLDSALKIQISDLEWRNWSNLRNLTKYRNSGFWHQEWKHNQIFNPDPIWSPNSTSSSTWRNQFSFSWNIWTKYCNKRFSSHSFWKTN